MTEEREDDYLVIVRAQVMTRDESTEGWLPLAGGGLANVSIRKRPRLPPHETHEYIIFGQRISDQTVILSCAINRELEYNKVMPTFHHWKAGKQRNGLTFQTAADARAFDKGVVSAFNELIAGMTTDQTNGDPSLYKYDSQAEEDEVFMTLNLPLEPSGSRSNSEGSGSQKSTSLGKPAEPSSHRSHSRSPPTQPLHTVHHQPLSQQQQQQQQQQQSHHPPPQSQPPQHSIHIISFDKRAPGLGGGSPYGVGGVDQPATVEQPTAIAPGDNYSYVQLTAVNDFKMPISSTATSSSTMCTASMATVVAANSGGSDGCGVDTASRVLRRDSIETFKKCSQMGDMCEVMSASVEKDLQKMKMRRRCRYCQEFYTEDWNKKGSCSYAPDKCRTAVERISAIMCARCMVYHCMSDAEGESVQNPCSCTSAGDGGCKTRWFGLMLLSLCCPCLCLYPPLRACHWLGVKCGLCGGRHKPQM